MTEAHDGAADAIDADGGGVRSGDHALDAAAGQPPPPSLAQRLAFTPSSDDWEIEDLRWPAHATTTDDACQRCGATPANEVRFHDVRSRIIWFERRRIEGRLCNRCAAAVFRRMQSTTLTRGWFGLGSAVATVVTAIGNVVGLRRVPDAAGWRPGPRLPLRAGPRVLARPAPWAACLVVVALIGLVVWASVSEPERDPVWEDGACVTFFFNRVRPVSCSDRDANAVVEGHADTEAACLTTGATYTASRDEGGWWCIDDTPGRATDG